MQGMSLQLMGSEKQLGFALSPKQLPKRGSEGRAGRNHSGPWQAGIEDFHFSPATKGFFPGVERAPTLLVPGLYPKPLWRCASSSGKELPRA